MSRPPPRPTRYSSRCSMVLAAALLALLALLCPLPLASPRPAQAVSATGRLLVPRPTGLAVLDAA